MREGKRLEFTGYSDDTFACSGPGIGVDYDTCASGEPVTFRVQAGGEALLVVGQYAPGACAGWLIGVSHVDDKHGDAARLPDWPMSLGRGPSYYSPQLTIDAPADVQVALVAPAPEARHG